MHINLGLLFQAVGNGIALGWLYILIALGLALIFSIMDILQFAHGEIYMIAAYISYFLCTKLGMNIYMAMIISMAAMAVIGVILERFLFRPVRGKFLNPLIVSLGCTYVFMSGATVWFGLYNRSLPKLAIGSITIFGGVLPIDRLVVVLFSIAFVVLLYLFLKGTKQGQAMVASAQNREGAVLRGINPNTMSRITMAVGCALAAGAGTLAGTMSIVSPGMGAPVLLKGFIIIVIGGMGSLLGAVFGGLIMGLVDGVIPIFADPAVASIGSLLIVIILLIIKPEGLFGRA
jgi:branched-chain amino acid transport system permease protein